MPLHRASRLSATRSPTPQPVGTNNYSRYPIHVERAIYRLSHIKLANPRRPLYEQVLISNLMFWYLGVINKAQAGGGAAAGTAQDGPVAAEKEQQEREQKEKEERERAEKERLERERERERRERLEQKSQPRKGSLTKTAAANRRAEMPVRGPQYDVQHQAMEQEYGYSGRAGSAPPSSGPGYYPSARTTRTAAAAACRISSRRSCAALD
ncbi:hypothetical protein EWM64_g7355 [Hericium alpestre]|uniref:Protein Zds1 C-terminal domain-containing protein n=1 Tax=Hericium alpestre TaxID=135208 RepID=A0A4Y9ZRI6_9AGAM|nr:hypothetical protein EWM64_g7355 [Hericium alpestre]